MNNFSNQNRKIMTQDRIASILVWSCGVLVIAVVCWIIFDILIRGGSHLCLSFFTELPEDAGRRGGISSILVSTFMILAVAIACSIPVSLATAVSLSDIYQTQNKSIGAIRKSLDILASVPSIVFGLFGNAFFCIALGMGYSIISGGLTLACMILPILIRTFEQAVRAVPDEYRFAAESLGMSKTSILFRVVLPISTPAMTAGLIISMGRVLAETAALIFTSGYVTRMPESIFDSGRSMSIHIYDLAMNVPNGSHHAYATASVLIAILLIINLLANRLLKFFGIETEQLERGLI